MDIREMFDRLESILENSKVGVLCTVDEEGKPHMRWMTPVLAKGRKGILYAVTSPKFRKTIEAAAHPDVEWLLQAKTLDEVVRVRGKLSAIDNPQLKSEIIEDIGRNLQIFWRINPDETELVVLETVIEEIEHFLPLKGQREYIKLPRGEK